MAGNRIIITEDAFKGVCGALFGSAIVAATARTMFRLRTTARYTLDDALLLFACICLTAATGLLYKLIPNAYFFEELEFNDKVSLPFAVSDIAKETLLTIRILDAYTLISWLVVYTAKFCFLSFFRALIDRVRRLIIYWRVVVFVTIIFGAFSLCEAFVACPRIEVSSTTCLQGSGFTRTWVFAVVVSCLDTITDVLLITIPICLLWNVRIKSRQKLGIGAFLCLSVVMIIVAIIKASGVRTSVDSFNLVWQLFWAEVEGCAAVLMVSLTTLRSIFISNKQKLDKNKGRTGIVQRFQIWMSSKKVSGGDIQHLSPSGPPRQTPPHVTLGTKFRSIQGKGLFGSQLQTLSHGVSTPHPQDLESGLEEESEDLKAQVGGTDSSLVTNSGSCEHQPGKEPMFFSSSQGTERSHREHWWQMGIISNFTASLSKDPDSEG